MPEWFLRVFGAFLIGTATAAVTLVIRYQLSLQKTIDKLRERLEQCETKHLESEKRLARAEERFKAVMDAMRKGAP